jgi:hypothetical protein
LLAAHEGYSASLGPNHERTLQVVKQLATLYEGWGQSAQAARWRAKLPK